MARRPATATDWHLEAMPEDAPTIAVDIPYSTEAFERIRLGFVPIDMDFKWFIYYDEPWLHLHRSWTGLAMYKVRFEFPAEGPRAVEVVVNLHGKKKTGSWRAETEAQEVKKWIDLHLVSQKWGPGLVLDDGVA